MKTLATKIPVLFVDPQLSTPPFTVKIRLATALPATLPQPISQPVFIVATPGR